MRPFVAAVLAALWLCAPAAFGRPAKPGQFDYYLLVLSWSPQFCAGPAAEADQCAAGRRFGFIVHGLWPENEGGGYPSSCSLSARVPGRVVDRVLPIMASERLVQHEWKVHGTCSGLPMEAYFGQIDQAYRQLRIPQALQKPARPATGSADEIKRLFTRDNPGLSPDMLAVACEHRDRSLREVRICLDRSLNWRRCGADQHDTCPAGPVTIRPVE